MSLSPHPLAKRLSKRATKLTRIFLVFVVLSHGPALGQAQKPSAADQSLLDAAYDLNVERVKQALESGADPNVTDKYGRTPLIIASGNDFDGFVPPRASEEIVRLLLKSGAKPNAVATVDPVSTGATALLGAIMFDQNGIIKVLLENGADPNLPDSRNETPLCKAAYRQNVESIDLLLGRGVDVNETMRTLCNPLVSCTERNHSEEDIARAKECLIHLLDAKADPNLKGPRAFPLVYAAMFGPSDLVRLLLDRGARADVEDKDGSTPLDYAQDLEVKEMLLAHGAKVNHQNKNGETALMHASSPEEVELLIQRGAAVNQVDKEGRPAIAFAASRGDPKVLNALLKHRPTLAVQTKDGDNLLHISLRQRPGNTAAPSDSKLAATVELLLKAGINLHERNGSGDLPIHLAADWGAVAPIQMLVQNGADLLAKDRLGKTPYERAVKASNEQAALLIQDLVTKSSPSTGGAPPLSFWNQFAVTHIDGRPVPISADPDPARQAQLEAVAYDLLKLGFSDTDGNLVSFWKGLSEDKRAELLGAHARLFHSYDPLRAFTPPRWYELQGEAETAAYALLNHRASKDPRASSLEGDLTSLDLSDGPLTALSAAHLASALPKSLGMSPRKMKREAINSFLFGTVTHLYGADGSPEKVVSFEESYKYFDGRVKIIGADLLRLYHAQRPLLAKTFNRPMIPLEITFQLSPHRTSSSVDTTSPKVKRYASLFYEDVVDSFHACIADELAPLNDTDLDETEDEKYLFAFTETLPRETQIFAPRTSSSTEEPTPPSREDAVRNIQSIRERLLRAKTLSLTVLAAQGPLGKWFSEFLLGLAKARPQQKDMPAFVKPYEKRLKALEQRYEGNKKGLERETNLVESWFTEYAVNAFLYDASRNVEMQFNNVLQFALAHELGHHVFGTTEVHDVEAEDEADAFAVTLLAGAYAHLSLTELSALDRDHPKRATGTRFVVLDGKALMKYIGYPVYFGSRLKQREGHSPLTSDYRKPDERVRLLTDRFRSAYRLLQNKIFADRVRAYRGRQVSQDVLDEFTSVVSVMGRGGVTVR